MGKNSKEGLGRALVKDRFNKNRNKRKVENNTMLHTTEINDGYDWGRLNLQSVTAESSLQEFLSTAELAAKEFTAEKLNIRYVKSTPSTVPTTGITDVVPNETLTVPRRPPWKPGITAEEQSEREKESFLDWRRRLVELQEIHGAAVTPYERNLELWKQLWRTLERSDLVLLLMDARNPLLFRCNDLENYAKEQNCKCVLLLNKADLIGEFERKAWAEYFNKEGIHIIFFSAAAQAEKLKQSLNRTDSSDKISEEDESDQNANGEENAENVCEDDTQALNETEVNDPEEIVEIRQQINELDKKVSTTGDRLNKIQDLLDIVLSDIQEGKDTNLEELYHNMNDHNSVVEAEEKYENIHTAHGENLEDVVDGIQNLTEIMDRDMLVEYLRSEKSKLKLKNPPRITFGLIGYPNVGKSSTVNVLMQTKKVSVSAMPGHTRHIQSLVLDDDIQLLDCPGLVLPAYAVTPDLLLTAVLPIDQMRAHDTAISRLCELIGRRVIETKYGLLLPHTGDDCISQKELLTAHAYNRGFMTASGQPDVSRSARFLLKDAASGRLQWAVMPPGVARPQHELEPRLDTKRKPTPQEARMVEGWTTKSSEIDKTFFTTNKNVAHLKGKPVAGLSPAGSVIISEGEVPSKPWKLENKHSNKKKREKLRITYRHLDEH